MLALLQYYFAWLCLSVLLWPLLRWRGAGFAITWVTSRVLAPTMFALLAFQVARGSGRSLGFGVVIASITTLIFATIMFRRNSSSYRALTCHTRRCILLKIELLLLLLYAGLSLAFGYHYGNFAIGERRLDLGLINWLMQSPTFPPENFWASGIRLSYYYFGCLQIGAVGLLGRVAGEHAYTAGLAATWASAFMAAWVASRSLRARGRASYLAPVALVFMASAAPLYHWFSTDTPPWHSGAFLTQSRVIPGAINETPAVAFWISEVHAHVLALPLFVILFPLLLAMLRRAGIANILRFSATAAALLMTDAWLVPVAALACALLTIQQVWTGGTKADAALRSLSIATVATALLATPLMLGFRGHPVDLRWVKESTTTAMHLVVLFAPLLILLALLSASCRSPIKAFVRGGSMPLIITGVAAVALCEILYLDTGFAPPAERQNTIMRFHWAAYLCLALAVAPAARLASRRALVAAWMWVTALVLFGLLSPLGNLTNHIANGRQWNPNARLALDPDRVGLVRAAEFLQRTDPDTIIVESSGPPYQGYATLSAISGRRAVLGELDKVVSHGISMDEIRTRQAAIAQIYTDGPSAYAAVKQYGIDYIILGPAEQRAYPTHNRAALLTKYPVAFRSGKIVLLKAE